MNLTAFCNKMRLHVGRVVSEFGRGLIQAGDIMQLKVVDDVFAAQSIQKIGDLVPVIGHKSFVAPNARVVGNPEIGTGCYIGYGASIRGDVNQVKLGNQVYIGDRVSLHATRDGLNRTGFQTLIGNNSVVGDHSVVIGATLEDNTFVDASCTVQEGAVVGQYAVIGPGSFVRGDARVASGTYWAGNPAVFVRKLSSEEIDQYNRQGQALLDAIEPLAETHKKQTQLKQSLLRE